MVNRVSAAVIALCLIAGGEASAPQSAARQSTSGAALFDDLYQRGQRRAAVGRLEARERRDTRTAREQGVAKLRVRRAEHRDDADA